ncbi:tetraacyldisaccharide 4'-kinase [Methylocystis echinoides]|uniref:Tetraacyldisaccharide 4'-kinase n=1 Tax=Methylocystis echinoides TaxID=29468 RepID=A0A9W6GTR2_9HYPH|nr:tetraacyldisaccharide 4'-kinase [Methylocystis echinoides]GLI92685.1 tetraacyldisaccharide 4'-kinase [Methylocystis echinoides]
MPRAPDFWRHDCAAARLLAPLGWLYGSVAARRLRRDAPRAPLPAIVVGGLTVGGDGKTPLVIALAGLLVEAGERPALLTRGYGAKPGLRPGAKPGAGSFVVAAGDSAATTGDEALLLARHALTIVGADRAASAELARQRGATVLILDDGFHSRRLAPDLALLTIDSDYGAGAGRCLPAGPLRAPLRDQFDAADALVIIGDGDAGLALAESGAKPAFRATVTGTGQDFKGRRVVAFSGIARPEKFFATLAAAGAEIVSRRAFADHHRFSAAEMATLAALADARQATLVTTEKDAVRLPPDAPRVGTLSVQLTFADADEVRAALAAALDAARLSRAS